MSQELERRFRRHLRAMLDDQGMSQSELARRMGVTPSFVNQLVSGHSRPGFQTLESVAKALGCDPAELIAEKVAAKTC